MKRDIKSPVAPLGSSLLERRRRAAYARTSEQALVRSPDKHNSESN
jgi:hypothetical protein